MQRDLLLTRIHKNLRERYQDEILRWPATTFQEVWEDLQKNFGVDSPHFWKQEWLKVRLDKMDGKVTLASWKLFQSQFLSALGRVADYTDSEVAERVLKQLPKHWVDKVLHREAKEAQTKFTSKIEGANCDLGTLRAILERAVGPIADL